MELREFRRQHGERTRLWQVWVDGETIYTCHGWQGGAIQKNKDVPGRSSRETAAERALSRAAKLVKDKLNKGYTEYVPGTDTVIGDVAGTEVNFDGAPPDGLEIFKPNTMPKKGSSEHKKMMAVINDGREVITRKYNGMKHLLTVTSDDRFLLHTRRMEDATGHYPHLIEEFRKLNIPAKSIVAVELCVPGDKSDGPEDFRSMQSLSRSLADRAVQLQIEKPQLKPHAVLLAPVFWNGKPLLKQLKVLDWMGVLERCVSDGRKRVRHPFVHPMKVFFGGLAKAFKHVEDTGIEGLVVYDGEACFGEKGFNFRGKADRPDCWKQKPIYEEDFFAVFDPEHKSQFNEGGDFGRGKNMGVVGNLALYQHDKKGNLVYICNVGTGLDDATRKEIAEQAKGYFWTGVVAVEYAERKFLKQGDISNALTFPSFQKIHEDKMPSECVNENL